MTLVFAVECIFNQDLDNTFSVMIDTIYKETSKHLMEVLHEKYKFMEHLKVCITFISNQSICVLCNLDVLMFVWCFFLSGDA